MTMTPREIMFALEARLYAPTDPSPEHVEFMREAAALLHDQGDGRTASLYEEWATALEGGDSIARLPEW